MHKTFYLISLIFLLNGCVESVALLSSTAGGASSGRLLQSSLQSTLSYGIKQQTGKTPLGHVLAYAERNNPERKKEACISFIEKTKSEFCTIAKKKLSLTNKALKEKVSSTVEKIPKINNLAITDTAIKTKNDSLAATDSAIKPKRNDILKDLDIVKVFQIEMINLKEKILK